MRSERFGLVLSDEEKAALHALAERERITAAAVVRRLIWRAAHELQTLEGTKGEEIGYHAPH